MVICTLCFQRGATSSKCTISTPRARNMSKTWGQLWPQLGPVLEQHRPKSSSTQAQHGRHCRPNPKSSKRVLSLFWHLCRFMLTTVPHVVPPLGRTWCEAFAKAPASCNMLNMTWTSMYITWLQIVHLNQFGPNFSPT